MNKKLLFLLSIVAVTILMNSCYKDKLDFSKLSTTMEWDPNMAAPAIHSTLTIRDLLRDYDSTELFVEDQTGFLFLMYHKEVFSIPASDIVTLPDQSFSDNFTGTSFSPGAFPAGTTRSATKNYTQTLLLGTDAIDSLIFKDATFTTNVTSTFLHTGLLTITFPTVRKNGLPYSKTININTSTGTFSSNQVFTDLTDYKANLKNPNNNQLPVNLSLTFVSSGAPITAGNQLTLDMTISNVKYSILWGNIGQRNFNIQEDTVNIELFNNTINANIYFMDPKIRLHIRNSFGVPIRATFNNFKIYSTVSNTYVPYVFPSAYSPLLIAGATIPGTFAPTDIQLDTANFSNIRSIVAENPRFVYLQTSAMTNPPGTTQYNYVMDTSRLAVDLEVELPLWGRASWWIMQDTLDFDFSDFYKDSVPDLDNIDWVKLKINILNGMPTEAGVQIYLTDTLYNVIDTIFTPANMEIIQSGILGGTGKVVTPTRKTTEVMIYGSRLAGLMGVKKALVRGYVHTTNQGSTNVRFYSDYALDVKMGVQVQSHFNTGTDF